jgi:lambda family phage portal protein
MARISTTALLDVTPPPTRRETLLGGYNDTDQQAVVGGAYEGSNRTDTALARWHPPMQSADKDILPEKDLIDARVRDSQRNDAYIQGATTVKQDSIVGAIFALNAKPASKALGPEFDDDWEEAFQEEVETKFTLWAESPDCWVDASRQNTFTEMVRLAVGLDVGGGECLASVEWLREFGRPFNTAIQFIDADRLSNPNTLADSALLRGGIQKNKRGVPLGYHIRMAHPSDYGNLDSWRWKYVRARKPWGRRQMIHIFDQSRPDQTRGLSEFTAALKEMRIIKKFRDVNLQQAVVNATYAASIESETPAEALIQMGAGEGNIGDVNAEYLTQMAEYTGASKNINMDGVKIPVFYPGTKLKIQQAGKGGPLGQPFEASLLRYLASAAGVSYEQLSKDYSSTNYSSARAALAETQKHMTSKKKRGADSFASMIYRLWLEEAINSGEIKSLPRSARAPGWLYTGQNFDALARCDWIGASRGQIDELKETQAAALRLKYNLSTDAAECAKLGLDMRDVKRQRAREKRMDEELNIVPEAATDMENALAAGGNAKKVEDKSDA